MSFTNSLKSLALPRGARVFSNINNLEKGLGKTRCIELQCVSASLPEPFLQIVGRDDGRVQIGLRCNAPGPFKIRASAKVVGIGEVRHARTT